MGFPDLGILSRIGRALIGGGTAKDAGKLLLEHKGQLAALGGVGVATAVAIPLYAAHSASGFSPEEAAMIAQQQQMIQGQGVPGGGIPGGGVSDGGGGTSNYASLVAQGNALVNGPDDASNQIDAMANNPRMGMIPG